ncbi:MAG: nuclear transport factor 2 family protein [Actinomycetota bacterium]|nr:nuclear transport factor 2 family protein [Actinomycetota bacterium]
MPTTDEMKAAVTAYAAAYSAGDIDGIVAVFDPQAVVADPVDQPAFVGHDAIREFFTGTHQVAESLDLQITGPIRAVDHFAAVPLRAVTTMGDSTFAVDIVDVFTFGDDGLITDMKAYWTGSDIQQLT